jgi:CHAT domain-containing protein
MKKTIECASDYFISSYTPILGVLLTQDCSSSTARFKMMGVIQSRELKSTRMELEKIEQHVPSDSLVKFGIPGATATVEAVATKLADVSIVHFACHRTQDQSNPLKSGLKLEDGWLRVS